MPEKLFNSVIQHLLVSAHRLVALHLDLQGGVFGKAYRRIYFTYKSIIDRNLVAAARKLAQPGTFVVDVGANIGFFSVTMARRTDVRLLAFEPDPQNYLGLDKVISENGLGSRIHSYMLALSDRSGAGLLYLSDLAPTDHKLIKSRSSKTVEISMVQLDEFFAQHSDHAKTPISLIKIDVQGAELLVLRGMQRTLVSNNYPPMLVEYSPNDLALAGTTPKEFFSTFEILGYRPHTLPDLGPRDPDWLIHNTRGVYVDLAMIHTTAS